MDIWPVYTDKAVNKVKTSSSVQPKRCKGLSIILGNGFIYSADLTEKLNQIIQSRKKIIYTR